MESNLIKKWNSSHEVGGFGNITTMQEVPQNDTFTKLKLTQLLCLGSCIKHSILIDSTKYCELMKNCMKIKQNMIFIKM